MHPRSVSVPVRIAPADEYFGKLKLSILGIRNIITDVGANIDVDQSRAVSLMSKADLAEDAMLDWQKKYPQDTWLPKTVFSLERMYAKIDSDDGRARSLRVMRWLVHDFPTTWYGRTGKREMAQHHVGHPLMPENVVGVPSGASVPATAANPSAPQPTTTTIPQ